MNVSIPPIIYGTAWKEADTQRLVTNALKLGFSGIDTAPLFPIKIGNRFEEAQKMAPLIC